MKKGALILLAITHFSCAFSFKYIVRILFMAHSKAICLIMLNFKGFSDKRTLRGPYLCILVGRNCAQKGILYFIFYKCF